MTTRKPPAVRCPVCADFKVELAQPGDGGVFQCCGVRWIQRRLELEARP